MAKRRHPPIPQQPPDEALQSVECPCGADMIPMRRALFMEPVGLPHLIIEDAPVLECARCGTRRVEIPQDGAIESLVAAVVARRPGKLRAAEVRYLRKWFGLSGKGLAARLGVSPVSVSRWEREKSPIDDAPEQLLRAQAVAVLCGLRPHERESATELWLRIAANAELPEVLARANVIGETIARDADGFHIPYDKREQLLGVPQTSQG